MNKDERIVNVTGEAYFDVAHDADKPFIVQTEGMRIVVHGTNSMSMHSPVRKYIGEFVEGPSLWKPRQRTVSSNRAKQLLLIGKPLHLR